MELIDLIRHRYIRTGDCLRLYNADGSYRHESRVTRIEGWDKCAAVRMDNQPYGAIRRDCIRKDALGRWFYRYGN